MNSMADNQKVYEAIKTIADELCKENKSKRLRVYTLHNSKKQ